MSPASPCCLFIPRPPQTRKLGQKYPQSPFHIHCSTHSSIPKPNQERDQRHVCPPLHEVRKGRCSSALPPAPHKEKGEGQLCREPPGCCCCRGRAGKATPPLRGAQRAGGRLVASLPVAAGEPRNSKGQRAGPRGKRGISPPTHTHCRLHRPPPTCRNSPPGSRCSPSHGCSPSSAPPNPPESCRRELATLRGAAVGGR